MTTGAEVDLSSEFAAGAEVVEPGQSLPYTIGYANHSDAAAGHAFLDIIFPPGVFLDEDSSWYDALMASHTDTLGNVATYFLDDQWCDALIVRSLGPGEPPPEGMNLPPQTAGEIGLTIAMPMDRPETNGFVIDAPQSLAGEPDFNPSGCFIEEHCGPDSCFGPRFFEIDPPASGDFKVVDDGSADPTLGCQSLVNDLTGHIALVRRGGCDFSVKALHAEDAGAIGVVVMNDDPGQSIFNLRMTGGANGHLVTIPVLMVSSQDGDAFEAALAGGETISGRLGAFDAASIPLTSWIFHAEGSPDTDPVPGNDQDTLVIRFASIFADGFESGTTTAWSDVVD
jgi:hypothetical protein